MEKSGGSAVMQISVNQTESLGFTLIETLTTITIIALLISLATVSITTLPNHQLQSMIRQLSDCIRQQRYIAIWSRKNSQLLCFPEQQNIIIKDIYGNLKCNLNLPQNTKLKEISNLHGPNPADDSYVIYITPWGQVDPLFLVLIADDQSEITVTVNPPRGNVTLSKKRLSSS